MNVHCKNNNKSWEHADKSNLKALKRYFSGKYLYEITSLDIEKFKTARLKEGVTPATVNRALTSLKSLFNRAIEWGKATENPARKVRLFKETGRRLRFLEKEEVTKLLNACADHLRPIVILALFTGIRKSKILGLKWRDIDIRRDIIYLYDTKNGERREIPMSDIVKKTLIKTRKHPNSPYIFHNTYGRPYKDVRRAFADALEKAKIKNFRLHDCRHTFASHLVMSGVDLNTVRELLGHKSIQMTLRYSHLSPEHKQRAVNVLAQKFAKKTPESAEECTEFVPQAVENKKDNPSHLQPVENKSVTNWRGSSVG